MENGEKNKQNVSVINNQYTKNQLQEIQKKQKRILYKRRRMTLVGLFIAVIIVISGISFFRDASKLKALKEDKVASEALYKQTKLEQRDLKVEVAQLKDEDYVAKLARSSQYLLSKEGEQVFIFPLRNTENKTDNATVSSETPDSGETSASKK